MSDIGHTLRQIRPYLKDVAPQTFWFTVGFGTFNVFIGYGLFTVSVLTSLNLLGVIPLKVWALAFFIHGVAMLVSLAVNNWKLTRSLHMVGIGIKGAWWLELLAATLTGRSAFLLYVWSLLIFLQFIVWIYFTPRIGRAK